jgi:2'-5' RNA ligase
LTLDDNGNLLKLNEEIVFRLGVKEDRLFKPHLTIGRVKEFSGYDDKAVDKLTFKVDSFYLMKSELTSKGPVYTVVKGFSDVML